jgi:nucleoid-associated protein YgaU
LKFNLKKILKTIKLNESSISMVLGIVVVIIAASLIVKYLKTDRGTIPQELLSGTNSIESSAKVHKVVKGENLWKIAVQYYGDGFKWVDIATENKLANASTIEVGQELTIPNLEDKTTDESSVTSTETISKANDTNTKDAITTATYEVVHGDTLWSIAVRSYGDGYKWTDIAKENKIVNPNIIHSGNILVLPR